ncbi:MAG TPA: VOC family protein [Candidatus Acidoferrum sp.]|nr:VOC family protein [Candidatus Acidoferrum sp.]
MAMEFHFGRLIDHVHLVVADLRPSRRFYGAVLAELGRSVTHEGEHFFACDELFISDIAFVGQNGTQPHRVHLAFQAPDRATVERFHRAGLAAGGRDNGPPGERGYHPGYYGAFLLDPDGNNVEAVNHGPASRSAASVVITPG